MRRSLSAATRASTLGMDDPKRVAARPTSTPAGVAALDATVSPSGTPGAYSSAP